MFFGKNCRRAVLLLMETAFLVILCCFFDISQRHVEAVVYNPVSYLQAGQYVRLGGFNFVKLNDENLLMLDRTYVRCPAESTFNPQDGVCKCNDDDLYIVYGQCGVCPEGTSLLTGTDRCVLPGMPTDNDETNCSPAVAYMNDWHDCDNLSEFETVCLADPRDYRTYRVRKFADGKCWTIDSLKFGGDYGQTDGCAANNGAGNFSSGGATSLTKAQERFSTGYYGHCRAINDNYNEYLYDWTAAMQSTQAYVGSSYNDYSNSWQGICPQGWHLPSNTGVGSYQNLASYYGSNYNVFWLEANKWNGKMNGHADRSNGSLGNQGTYGNYWASTYANAQSSYSFAYGNNGSIFYTTHTDYKSYGRGVRCIDDRYCGTNGYDDGSQCVMCPVESTVDVANKTCLCPANTFFENHQCLACPVGTTAPAGSIGCFLSGMPADADKTNCQVPIAYTNDWHDCDNLSELETVCLADPRDYRTYRVRKFADGKCWMIDSLKYGGDYGEADGCSANSGAGNFSGGGSTSAARAQQTFVTGYYGHCRQNTVDNNYLYDWVATMQNTLAYQGSNYNAYTQPVQGVCPAGLHLPQSSDFTALRSNYGSVVANFWTNADKWNGKYSGVAVSNGSITYSRGDYWASTYSSTANAYGLYYNTSSSTLGAETHNKYDGKAVRCVTNRYCEADYYAGDNQCVACPEHSHAASGSATIADCICDSGYNKKNDGTCVSCPANSTWDASSETCQCSANMYMDEGQCVSCPANSTSTVGSTSFAQCNCNANLYMNEGQCTACPNGSTSEAGGTQLSDCKCAANTFMHGGQCVACPDDSSAEVGSTICTCNDSDYRHIVSNGDCEPILNVHSEVLDTAYDSTNCVDPVAWMDEWDLADCYALSELGTACVVDRRDHRAYQVRKFADGNCWMVDSLKFGGDYGETDGCVGIGNFASGGSNNATNAREQFSTGYYGHCRQNTVDNNYLYDWVAAMQNTLAYYGSYTSISGRNKGLCSTNWHVPTASEMEQLRTAYATDSQFWADSNKGNFVRAGAASSSNGNLEDVNNGHYWTSSFYDYKWAYELITYLTSSSMNYRRNKNYGLSVRCLQDRCAANMYVNGGTCVACPTNSTSNIDSNSITDCKCAANYYMDNGQCTACPEHSTGAASSTSIDNCKCAANYYMSGGQCLACPGGGTGPVGSTSVNNCQCPVNTYMDNGQCTACPAGMSSSTGSTSISDCACPVGYYWETATSQCVESEQPNL
ncbi:hypothetical protein IJJ27_00335 [bacterium]|nr:hypothetical protein [bacterium]